MKLNITILLSMFLSLFLIYPAFSDEIPICIDTAGQNYPDVAWNGTNFLVVWQDGRDSAGIPDIYGQIVSADGLLIGENIPICTADEFQAHPKVSPGDSTFLVVWNADIGICGQLLSGTGELIGTNLIISPLDTLHGNPDIEWSGAEYMVVFQIGLIGSFDVYIDGQRISYSGIPIGERFPICIADDSQAHPVVEWGGDDYLVVWENGGVLALPDLYGQRVSSTGDLVYSSFVITAEHDGQFYTDIASNGENYLVVWQYSPNGQFVSTDGELIDENFPIGIGGYYPAIASCDSNYLVVWTARPYSYYFNIFGRFISSGGEFISDTFYVPCSSMESNQDLPSICYGNENYFVVWWDFRDTNDNIYGRLISSSGIKESKINLSKIEITNIFPNPFNSNVEIELNFDISAIVSLHINNIIGARVSTLLDNSLINEGIYSLNWNGTDEKGESLPSGIYLIELNYDGMKKTKKTILLR